MAAEGVALDTPKPFWKRETYYAALKWRDFTSSAEQLLNVQTYTKNQPLEIFLHGCDSIALDKEIQDKVQGLDIRLENCRTCVNSKPRYLRKTGNSFKSVPQEKAAASITSSLLFHFL